MKRTHSLQRTSELSTSRPFFSKTSSVQGTVPFFPADRSGFIQRQTETSSQPEEKEEEKVVQEQPHETTIQRMCAECEQEQREKSAVQLKLNVGEAGDQYEQEADRVADQVVDHLQTAEASSIQTKLEPAPPTITPLVMCHGEGTASVSPNVEQGIQHTRGSGEAMAPTIRRSMEHAMGADFSGIRIHTHGEADTLNRSLNARAFTTGQNIYFKSGEYQPETPQGQKLLAHELTHVVQQRAHGIVIQRFTTCGSGPSCPTRDRDETARSRTSHHNVEYLPTPTFGVVISNFAVDDEHVKPDLHSNPTWIGLVTHMGLPASDEWEILGFTDCEGPATRNVPLREERANQVAALLPSAGRAAVRSTAAAPIIDCITVNTSEWDRSRNRSVLVRRLPGSRGPSAPAWTAGPVGPIRPPGSPAGYCEPCTSSVEAAALRALVENTYLPFARYQFGIEVHNLWRDYLNRPKGASLAPRVFRGRGHPIVDAFRTDPETIRHQSLLYADIVAAGANTPEAHIPFTGPRYTSPSIPLGTLLPSSALIRTINYTEPAHRIPGNIAGGTGVMGTASSDAGPDLRLITGSVRIDRTRASTGAPEVKTAIIDLQLQVIDAVDFCPGASGSGAALGATIPMSRLEATPSEPTYDLPFHVFVDLGGSAPIP